MPLSNRQQVNLLVGGTILTDTEVDHFVNSRALLDSDGGTISVNIPAAAADAAGAIAALYAREFNFAEDGQRFDRAQKHGHYLALERELRNRAGGVAVSIGGTATTT